MGKKHKKHKPEWRTVDDYEDKALEKPLKLVLKVGGSEVTELSGSGHDSSYYDDRSDHERERHKEKKKKKKKKSEKDKDKYVDDEERRRRKEEKRKKREREQNESEAAATTSATGVPVEPFTLSKTISISLEPEEKKKKKDRDRDFEIEPEVEEFRPNMKVEIEQSGDRPVRACRTQQENESTPRQQLLEHFLRQLQRKDPHGFFAFPVTEAIAPGYSTFIKHPMDFSTMKDKIINNEYNTVTEFKADFKLMCDNATVYNRPETVYYKAAKKLLHTGFKMMSKERLLALKRSMSFMQDMDYTQQVAILGDEDLTADIPPPEIIPLPVESAKKSKKQPVKVMKEVISYLYEPEGNACSVTDSTAEEHVLALVEHSADEARDRINRYMPSSKIGHLRKETDGSLLYTVVNQLDPDAEEEETHKVDLSSLSNKLLPGLTTLGFKDDRRHKVTFLSSAYNVQTLQNNSVFPDLQSDEIDMLYSAYGDETGVQCALSLQEFVKGCGSITKRWVDELLDKMTASDHLKAASQIREKRNMVAKPDEANSSVCDMQMSDGTGLGDSGSVLDFMSMKNYPDMSLDISMLNSLGKTVKKEPGHEEGQQHFDDTDKLLQEFQEAQVDRVGSRPSSNLSSLSNASERDQHHLGSPSHLGDQSEMVHDPYEFLQSPEPENTPNS
ncbi:bromodomain-containing protein 9 isoform X2 [Takifugu flavidus]|uniref:Bromodomain-containing protein 9 n=1 Tax=Takifugu flavidus TaxID=433684 RepID=A0A5C6PKM5_9TELE|nr:bromodomain-containing protein 9 isoform X2 [Takifugu flavidus]TWW79288.1 Bromodomain-containing protein 9 [Takifugu flavidus]|eukprot:XP_011603999.1 PREDICTED: bromodomain-containing protein 9 [Takifugu rubripes]